MVLKSCNFEFFIKKNKIKIRARRCESIFSKMLGLMFKKKSENLLFVFRKEKNLSIHSFFCVPFIGIWLDSRKKAVAIEKISQWKMQISHRGMYLLELPMRNLSESEKRIFTTFK